MMKKNNVLEGDDCDVSDDGDDDFPRPLLFVCSCSTTLLPTDERTSLFQELYCMKYSPYIYIATDLKYYILIMYPAQLQPNFSLLS